MKYIVSGISIVNDIVYTDRPEEKRILGGAIYSASGIKLYTDDIVWVTTGGSDYFDYYGEYFDRNGYDRSAVYMTLPMTHYSRLVYAPDGSWEEFHLGGPDFFDRYLRETSRTPEMLAPFCGADTMGIALDSHADDPFWERVGELRKLAPNAKLSWEVQTFDSENPDKRELVERNIRCCDMFSMNLKEASCYFDERDEQKLIDKIRAFGVTCFLRAGERGAYLVRPDGAWFVKSILAPVAVDVTGCGNTSTAAAFYGICEGMSPEKAALCGNIAAGFNVRERGPMANPAAHREEALKLLEG